MKYIFYLWILVSSLLYGEEIKFIDYTPFTYQSIERMNATSALKLVLTHPAGLAFYRWASSLATGRNQSLFRRDVEAISTAGGINSISSALAGLDPATIQWAQLKMLWSTLVPFTEGVDINRLRNLAIMLQDLDEARGGIWGYARLRQKVHNFPTPDIIQELEQELQKIGNSNQNDDNNRRSWLAELIKLERDFWYGTGLDGELFRQWFGQLGINIEKLQIDYHQNLPASEKIQRLLKLREYLHLSVGNSNGESMLEIMRRRLVPLSLGESRWLAEMFQLDSLLRNELMVQFGRIELVELRNSGKFFLSAIAKTLYWDQVLSFQDLVTIDTYTQNLQHSYKNIEILFGAKFQNVQSTFSGLERHLQNLITSNQSNLSQLPNDHPWRILGTSDRLRALSDFEIRQGPLFNTGQIVKAALQATIPQIKIAFAEGHTPQICHDVEILQDSATPVIGKVFVVNSKDDVHTLIERANNGERLVVIKAFPFDIELPPVAALITMDPALNRASHMALLAQNRRIPHANFNNGENQALQWMANSQDRSIAIKLKGGVESEFSVTLAGGRENHWGEAKTIHLPDNFDDTFSHPINGNNLLEKEAELGKKISGGKGRGTSFLAQAGVADIPRSVQLPYGFFMRWLMAVDLYQDWQEALKSKNAVSDRWRVVERAASLPIPHQLLNEVITALGGDEQLNKGWFVRSNANSEDGNFNAAGVNRTISDVASTHELNQALREVFLGTYSSRGRSWWYEVFDNPQQVRSTVLLMETIRAEKSSVALVAADGNTIIINSLPGVGENVVAAEGAVAERLIYRRGNNKQFHLESERPAFATKLKLWNEKKQIEDRELIFFGQVLTSEERSNMTEKIFSAYWQMKDHEEFRGKNLDFEVAIAKGKVHPLQMRVAPEDAVTQNALVLAMPKISEPLRSQNFVASQIPADEILIDNIVAQKFIDNQTVLKFISFTNSILSTELRTTIIEKLRKKHLALLDEAMVSAHPDPIITSLNNLARMALWILNRNGQAYLKAESVQAELMFRLSKFYELTEHWSEGDFKRLYALSGFDYYLYDYLKQELLMLRDLPSVPTTSSSIIHRLQIMAQRHHRDSLRIYFPGLRNNQINGKDLSAMWQEFLSQFTQERQIPERPEYFRDLAVILQNPASFYHFLNLDTYFLEAVMEASRQGKDLSVDVLASLIQIGSSTAKTELQNRSPYYQLLVHGQDIIMTICTPSDRCQRTLDDRYGNFNIKLAIGDYVPYDRNKSEVNLLFLLINYPDPAYFSSPLQSLNFLISLSNYFFDKNNLEDQARREQVAKIFPYLRFNDATWMAILALVVNNRILSYHQDINQMIYSLLASNRPKDLRFSMEESRIIISVPNHSSISLEWDSKEHRWLMLDKSMNIIPFSDHPSNNISVTVDRAFLDLITGGEMSRQIPFANNPSCSILLNLINKKLARM